MKITQIPLEQAVGLPLAHDLTQIDAKNHKKSARFKKGQIITEADLETLRSMGRENLSVMELSPGDVHEDDAAIQLGEALCGENLRVTPPAEGRCNLVAETSGMLCYLAETVNRVNQDPDWVLSALAPNRPVPTLPASTLRWKGCGSSSWTTCCTPDAASAPPCRPSILSDGLRRSSCWC